jgi:hypothetical protein
MVATATAILKDIDLSNTSAIASSGNQIWPDPPSGWLAIKY